MPPEWMLRLGQALNDVALVYTPRYGWHLTACTLDLDALADAQDYAESVMDAADRRAEVFGLAAVAA